MFSENNYQVHLDVENVHQKKKKKDAVIRSYFMVA